MPSLKSDGIDALLIVAPSSIEFLDTPCWIDGYGVAVRTFLILWTAEAYFITQVILVDTTTQKYVREWGFYRRQDIKFSKWKESFSELRIEEQTAMKDFFKELSM